MTTITKAIQIIKFMTASLLLVSIPTAAMIYVIARIGMAHLGQ
jgi:hypothetical protein